MLQNQFADATIFRFVRDEVKTLSIASDHCTRRIPLRNPIADRDCTLVPGSDQTPVMGNNVVQLVSSPVAFFDNG